MSFPILTCDSLSKSFGSHELFDSLQLSVFKGDKIAIVGPNGAGKSTLLKMIMGHISSDTGKVVTKNGLIIAEATQNFNSPFEKIEDLINSIEEEGVLARYEIEALFGKFSFYDFDVKISSLSGGWKKKLQIAEAVAKKPDVLLLDEPTNHLDLESIRWIERFLREQNLTFIVVSHDRYFLNEVANRYVEINRVYPKGIFSVEGNYETFIERRIAFLEAQKEYQHSLNSRVKYEVEWLKSNPKARTTKSTARISQAERLKSELQEVSQRNSKMKSAEIEFNTSPRETKKLVALKNIGATMGGKTLFQGIDLVLSPGTKLGILGPNGCGKTTLLQILALKAPPTIGTIKYVDGLNVVYFDQQKTHLSPTLTLRRALSAQNDFVNYRGQQIHVNGWCKRFLFEPERLDLPLSELSGGEKARILIAHLMLQPSDLLILDEPTNDLDIQTLEVLEESLLEFQGAIVLVTHDRFLMQRVCNKVIDLTAKPIPEYYADYTQWQQQQVKTVEKKGQEKKATEVKEAPVVKAKLKLSYQERQELSSMEGEIAKLEVLEAKLQEKVNQMTKDGDMQGLHDACEELNAVHAKIEARFRRWEELNQLSN